MNLLTDLDIEVFDPDSLSQPLPTIADLLGLYEAGLLLQAYKRSLALGPFDGWQGPDALVMAGRLTGHLGGGNLSDKLFIRAWRQHPQDLHAAYYYAFRLFRRSPLRALRFFHRQTLGENAAPELRAHWLALRAQIYATLRDFEAAEKIQAQAERHSPDDAWLCVERANIYRYEDRFPDALKLSQEALRLRPWYRPALEATAGLLVSLNRDGEALELLSEAVRRIEHGSVYTQLAELQTALGRHEEARASWRQVERLLPLLEEEGRAWLCQRQAAAAYHCGDFAETVRLSEKSGDPLSQKLAAEIKAAPPTARRLLLEVPFVQQHQVTCAPATLVALSQFWNRPAEHLEVAAEICYDGTPAFSERRWAEQNAWAVREFTLNWDSAVELLNHGVPFALATLAPGMGHMQAVTGYDERTRAFIIRDSNFRGFVECDADKLLADQRSSGPRAIAMVPLVQAHLLENLTLPDADWYDCLYSVQDALDGHRLADAKKAVADMRQRAPGHRLTWWAQMALAGYKQDYENYLAALNALLAMYPGDDFLTLSKLNILQQLAKRDERLEELAELCRKPKSNPLIWRQYALELMSDGRTEAKAVRWLVRSHLRRPGDAENYYHLARLLWLHHRYDESLLLFRFAFCLEDKKEGFARAYFIAARQRNRQEEALSMLRKRFKLFGAQSPEPAQTLFDAYWQLERSDEAFAVLEEARQMLPEDGPLSLFAANAYYQIGKYRPARSHLSKSRGLVAEDEWLIVAARGESVRGNRAAALSLWRKVAENAPFNIEAHSQCARLVAEADGDLAAQAYLRQASSQRPQYLPLQKLYIEWLRDDTQAQEAALRAVLRQDQADLWAHHELAALLGRHHRWPEAFAVNDTLQQLAPYAPEVYLLRGQLLLATQKREEAQSNFRYALQLAVSVERGVSLYLAACRNLEERRQALHFVRDQILQQHNIGESVIAFAELARGVFNPDELHGHLREIWQRRPDLWETWAALIGHLNDAQHQDAITLAQRAVERFPQIPGVWRLQAGVWRSSGKLSEEIAALRQGLSINPLWAPLLQELAYAYRKDGQEAAARQLLRQAVFQSPRDPLLHGCLAEALWPAGERETAISELRHAILLAPDYEWAWRMLYEWSEETGRPHLASDLARELTVKNPGEVNSWLNLSKTLKGREAFPERLKAADEALRLNPHSIAARVWKARLLANNQRLDEALQVCREPLWGAFIPADLRHLAALILSEQGDTQKALQEMEKLSREESDYAPVWETLLDWRTRQENWPEVLRAAQALVNLQPQNPDVWIDLGRARRFANDSGGAVTAFQQAFTLDPAHPAAGEHYFTLQLEEGDLNGARQTLSRRLPFIQTAARLFGELRLALQYRDETKALELLRQLCVTPEAASDHYQGALEALKKAGALPKALTVFEQSLQAPDVNPVVGPIWVSQCAGANELNTVEKVFSQSGVAPATWPQTAHAFLTETANGGVNDVVERFIQAHGPRLAADNLSWGGVGYALNQIGAYEKNRQYMRDWRQREGLQAWMLWNLALSLRSLNEIAEARAVSFRACALEDPDAADHYVLLAFDDALTGNSKEARQHFAQTPPTDSAWQQAVGRFTRLLLEADNAASVSEGLRELLDFGSQHQSLWGASLLARMYQQTIEHLVARTEGKLARLKAKWQVSQARRAAQKSG